MEKGSFMDIISVHYKDIKKLFVSRISNHGLKFNEDSFNDAFIKCAQHFGNDIIAYDDAIKYFYVAFSNTVKGDVNRAKHFVELDDSDDANDETSDDDYANYVYDTVMNAITERFDENSMMIYSLYKYHGWSKQELEAAEYDCTDFDKKIHTIHQFVKSYKKSNLLKYS